MSENCGVNVQKFFFGNSVPNIVTDFAILCLPLPYKRSIFQESTRGNLLTEMNYQSSSESTVPRLRTFL